MVSIRNFEVAFLFLGPYWPSTWRFQMYPSQSPAIARPFSVYVNIVIFVLQSISMQNFELTLHYLCLFLTPFSYVLRYLIFLLILFFFTILRRLIQCLHKSVCESYGPDHLLNIIDIHVLWILSKKLKRSKILSRFFLQPS